MVVFLFLLLQNFQKLDYIKETQCKMIGTILTIGSSLNICFACAYFYSEAFIFKGHCIKMFWYLSIHYKSSKRYNRLQVVNVKNSFAKSRSYITQTHNWLDCMRHTMKESIKYTIFYKLLSFYSSFTLKSIRLCKNL